MDIPPDRREDGGGEVEMNQTEKVILGLECCFGDLGVCNANSCPYYDGSSEYECEKKLRDDAIRLLRQCKDCAEKTSACIQELQGKLQAQTPRVMTATEAYTADYVYIEFNGVITPAIRTTKERDGHRESYFATQQLGGDWMRWDDYGITWRCWTSRLDDERRQNTSWEAEH